ncbi:MAG TPA: zf-HC2 domain-containing protein [Bacilli bacterium]|nr:zf-HC2 domain-containing protein [Bacilli bacterium]
MNHLADSTILSYLEGDLDDAELDLIEEHMEVCDECADKLALFAELGAELPSKLIPLELPSAGFADRVMEQVMQEAPPGQPKHVVPIKPRRKLPPQLEVFTRFLTAAVVTGFMVLGSTQVQGVPVIHQFSTTVTQTGESVSQGTVKVYAEFRGLLHFVSTEVFDKEGL